MAPLALAGANPKKPPVIDPNSKEGYLLELIQAETNPQTKLLLLEQFVRQFPKFDSLDAVYEVTFKRSMWKADFYDKAIAAGEKLLTLDPQDIDCARRNLDAAQKKKDTALTKQWTERVQKLAEELSASPLPKNADDVALWQERVNLARQLLGSEEYTLYKKAYDSPDPRNKIELIEQLQRRYPSGMYSKQAQLLAFSAYREMGDTKKAFAVAERIAERDQTHEDVLLVVADTLFRTKADTKRLVAYSNKIVELVNSKPKPAGLSDTEWSRQKGIYSGAALSMIGGVYLDQELYPQADRTLRTALQYLQGQAQARGQQLAATLSYLGWANYKLKNYAEATKFYTQCMAISGPYQESAIKNLSVIKSEDPDQH